MSEQAIDQLTTQLTAIADATARIEAQLAPLDARLEAIEEQQAVLARTQSELVQSARNMDEHITFIDALYARVQKPFAALMGWSSAAPIKARDIADEDEQDAL